MGFIVVPTPGQLQVPQLQQSCVRLLCTVGPTANVTEQFTAEGEPSAWFPDLGFVAWRYVSGGVARYGKRVRIELSAQVLLSDQPQLVFDRLLVVPRTGVNILASLRRIAI